MEKDLISVLLENFESFNSKTKNDLKELFKNVNPATREGVEVTDTEDISTREKAKFDEFIQKLDEV